MKRNPSMLLNRKNITANNKSNTKNTPIILKKILEHIYKKRVVIIIIAVIVALIFIFFGFLKMILILGSLVLVTVLLSIICRGIPYVGRSFELIMFTSVIAGTAYGAKMGAIFGLITAILYYFAAGRMSIHISVFAPLYALVGITASFLTSFPIFFVGIFLTIVYTLISSTIIVLVFGGRIEKALIFLAMNLFFNFILFKYIAPLVLIVAQ